MTAHMKTTYPAITPFVTKDGSIIRELMHPQVHGNRAQSLAEAIVPARSATLAHRHQLSEEIYHFTAGQGHMRLGDDELVVNAGDTVCIPPGIPHALINPYDSELRLLCCSSPAYAHDDTEILQS